MDDNASIKDILERMARLIAEVLGQPVETVMKMPLDLFVKLVQEYELMAGEGKSWSILSMDTTSPRR